MAIITHGHLENEVNTMDVNALFPCARSPQQQWASCQIGKIAGCACAGNAGNVYPRLRLERKSLDSDPGMHHGTCVTHVPCCMSGSLTRDDGENVPGIPGACAIRNFTYLARYWFCCVTYHGRTCCPVMNKFDINTLISFLTCSFHVLLCWRSLYRFFHVDAQYMVWLEFSKTWSCFKIDSLSVSCVDC